MSHAEFALEFTLVEIQALNAVFDFYQKPSLPIFSMERHTILMVSDHLAAFKFIFQFHLSTYQRLN